jgi:hypothetical protein
MLTFRWSVTLLALLGLGLGLGGPVTSAMSGETIDISRPPLPPGQPSPGTPGAPPAPRKTALFVINHAGPNWNDKVPVLESQIASQLPSADFTIISRDDVQKALKVFPVGPTRQQPVGDRTAKDQNLLTDRNTLGTQADRILSDNTSVLRLAQTLGADYLLVVTITGIDRNETHFKDAQLEFNNVEFVLQANYRILEGNGGAAIVGDEVRTTRRIKVGTSTQRNEGSMATDLLRDAAGKIAQSVAAKAQDLQPIARRGQVQIRITAGLRDLEGQEISLADLKVNERNEVLKSGKMIRVEAEAVVEIDGIAEGATPATFSVAPGLHKLRVVREGCTPYEATINAKDGLTLYVTLQLNEESLHRWQEIRAFLNHLDNRRKITDAQVKVLEGYGEFLQKSRVNIKVDTKEGMKFNMYRNIY